MKKLFLMIFVVLCFAGCADNNLPTSTPLKTQEIEVEKEIENARKIEIVADKDKYSSLNVYEDCEYDFTGMGKEERVVLATSAQKDEDDIFMWDDSQNWALYVETEEGIYPLYDDRLHGKLSLNVSEHYLENGETQSVIRLIISSGASFEIREYTFSNQTFLENVAYSAGAINEISINKYYA